MKGIRQPKRRKLVTGRAFNPQSNKTEQVSLKPLSWKEPHITNAATELRARIDAGDQSLFVKSKPKNAADDSSSEEDESLYDDLEVAPVDAQPHTPAEELLGDDVSVDVQSHAPAD